MGGGQWAMGDGQKHYASEWRIVSSEGVSTIMREQPDQETAMTYVSADELLASYDPAVSAIALKAREVVLATLPGVIEMVDVPAKMLGYGYEQTYKGTICAIALHKAHVN